MSEADNHENRQLARAALGGPLEALILELWQKTRIDWGFVTDRLSNAFRANRSLGPSERRFVSESLYGMVRHLRRLDAALEASGISGVGPADRARLIAFWVLEFGLDGDGLEKYWPSLNIDALRGVDEKISKLGTLDRLATAHSLPDFLAKDLLSEYGDEAFEIAAALNVRAPMTVRTNALKSKRETLQNTLAKEGFESEATPIAAHGLRFKTRTNIFALDAFREGHFEAQDEGSQLIAEMVVPPPKSLAIDYCAGAGGKTLAISAALENRGRVLACDVDERKLKELKKRAKRAGADNVQSLLLPESPEDPWPKELDNHVGRAKRVLVDAPCTGIGALRRNPEAKWRLSPADMSRLPKLQKSIIRRAWDLVGPGGRLIYATCTLLEAENWGVISDLMEHKPAATPIALSEYWGKERADRVVGERPEIMKVLPNRHGCDGFFAVSLRRPKEQKES